MAPAHAELLQPVVAGIGHHEHAEAITAGGHGREQIGPLRHWHKAG